MGTPVYSDFGMYFYIMMNEVVPCISMTKKILHFIINIFVVCQWFLVVRTHHDCEILGSNPGKGSCTNFPVQLGQFG